MRIHEREGQEGVPPGFLDLPAIVYRDDARWLPEDPVAVAASFTPRNDYFSYGQARTYCVPGKVRAAAFHEPEFRIDGEKVAFFGYFESTGDAEANAAVMARIEAWARARGARRLYGPIQFNTINGYRLRLSAEPGALPFLGEPQNPESYPAMLEAMGLQVCRRYVTQLVPLEKARAGLQLVEPIYRSLLAQGYRFETPAPENWARSLPRLYEMMDVIFSQNFAFSRISYPFFAATFEPTLLRRICPHGSTIVLDAAGEAVSFGLAVPHYGPLIVQGRGAARVAVSDLDYNTHAAELARQPPRGCIGKTIGVLPSHRRKGLMEAMLYHSFQQASSLYDLWYGALIREDNYSRRTFAFLQVGEREYGLYAKAL